ncbi:hypothetical protein HDK77DRAFT_486898 [Phyllosticta capitalensis]|uniref:uncharacterized protein n=1 Tax=Phyllosticta capitalensis TaxID=121624 RepID=UPI00312F9FBA
MKASGIVALTLLSAAAAAPHGQHAQLHQNKRDMVWITETDIVVETTYQTTTVYVNPGEAVPTAAATTEEVPAAATTEEPVVSSTPEPTTTPSSTIVPSTTPLATSSTPTSTYVAPTTLVPVVSSSASPSSTYVAPSSTAVQSSAAPAASSASSNSGSTSVNAADVHTAHLTYYSPDVGTSYCGPVYANTQPVVALASGQMSQSMCNKKIKISSGGKTVDAFIGDSCPGCAGTYGLDLSPSLFSSLTALADGVIDGATWWFA